MRIKFAFPIFAFIGLLFIVHFSSVPVQAATTNLTCQATELANRTALVNAVNTANTTNGNDTINLPANCTYVLTTFLNITDTTGSLTINGGDVNRPVIDGNNSTFLFQVQPNAELKIDSVNLTDGQAFSGNGGAIINQGEVTLNDLVLNSHQSGTNGGGIYNNGGTLTITKVSLEANSASDYGGGIYNNGGTVTLDSATTFTSNSAVKSGGAIYNTAGGEVTVEATTFTSNTSDYGGAIFNGEESTLTVLTSSFNTNTVDFEGGGGAIYNEGTASITSGTFTQNSAEAPGFEFEDDRLDGGAIYNAPLSTLAVEDSNFLENKADGRGAAIFVENSTATVINSNFTSNANTDSNSGGGGGIYNLKGNVTVNGGTYFDNWRSGIVTRGEPIRDAILNVSNVTFDANGAPEGTGIQSSYSTTTVTNTIFKDSNFTNSGGGMRIWESAVTINGGNFTNNSATEGGAIYILSSSIVNIEGTAFINNTASSSGGALYVYETGSVTVNIENATFEGNEATNDDGGAIYSNYALNLTNTNFDANTAPNGNGGAVYNTHLGTVTIRDGDYTFNSAENGGALYNAGGVLDIDSNPNFDDNTATAADFSEGGGAIFTTHEEGNPANGGELIVDDSFFNRNIAGGKGGAIYSISNTITMTDTRLGENQGNHSNINTGGGALFASNSTVNLAFVKFPDNKMPDGSGGAVFMGGGTLNVSDSFFNFNEADGAGAIHLDFATATFTRVFMYQNTGDTGAMYVMGGETEIINTTISGNTSTSFVGGVYTQDENDMTVRNATVTGNSGPNTGGLYANFSGSGSFTIDNTIVALNTSAGAPDVKGSFNSGGYNIFGNSATATITGNTATNITANPVIGPAQDNGGFTWTHALLDGSPAIDGGNCTLTEDQRDELRPVNYPGVSNAANGCDIGAFERQLPAATTTPTSTTTATATATPTDDPGAVATATPTPTDEFDGTPTATTDPGATATATATTDPEATPTATATVDPDATATATTDPEATPTATNTPAPEPVIVDVPQEPEVNPTFTWDATGADWYQVVVTLQNGALLYSNWFPAADVCTGSTCTFTLDQSILPFGVGNGDYTVTINGWTWTNEDAGEGTLDEAVALTDFSVTASEVVDGSSGRPIITFNDDAAVSWINIYVGTADFSQQFDYNWYEKATAATCTGGVCTLAPDAHPNPNGNYVVYLQTWDGASVSAWQGPFFFSLNFPAAPLITPVSQSITDGHPTLTWNGANGTTWYQVWVGTADYSTTLYVGWQEALALGCNGGGVCTLTLNDVTLTAGTAYEWWVQAWGPGGTTSEGASGWQKGGDLLP
ncbi:MAG: hypothetical protein OHK0046_33990 [Anaerolineae bacterium]